MGCKLSVNCIFTKVCKIILDLLKSSYPTLPTRNTRRLIFFELQQQMCWTPPGKANAQVTTLVHMNLILLVAIIIYGLLGCSDASLLWAYILAHLLWEYWAQDIFFLYQCLILKGIRSQTQNSNEDMEQLQYKMYFPTPLQLMTSFGGTRFYCLSTQVPQRLLGHTTH